MRAHSSWDDGEEGKEAVEERSFSLSLFLALRMKKKGVMLPLMWSVMWLCGADMVSTSSVMCSRKTLWCQLSADALFPAATSAAHCRYPLSILPEITNQCLVSKKIRIEVRCSFCNMAIVRYPLKIFTPLLHSANY